MKRSDIPKRGSLLSRNGRRFRRISNARSAAWERKLRGGREIQNRLPGDTGFREAVRVEYDPEQVSLDALLLAYFYVIDPTVKNRQGNDVGSQYQTGVYYMNDMAKATAERIWNLERAAEPSLRWSCRRF